MKLNVNFRDALSTGFTGAAIQPNQRPSRCVAKINLGGAPEIPDLLSRGNLPPQSIRGLTVPANRGGNAKTRIGMDEDAPQS